MRLRPGGDMRITAAESFSVFAAGPRPSFSWRRGLQGSAPDGQIAVLRIRTDEGAEGVAIASRRGSDVVVADALDRYLRDELIGADPLQREWLWHRMWELDRTEEMTIYLLGLVDTALWDLAGRLTGMPTWRLLGGFRTEIPAYASTTTFASTEEYLEVADQCIELGYPAIKLHAWGDARRDAQLCTALRGHVGDDYPLMYDGSAGFDLSDAIYVGDALADAGYLWYEEPIRGVQRHRLQMARRTGPGTPQHCRNIRRRSHEHRRLCRHRVRHVRAGERRTARRLHRCHAHGAPGRRLPVASRTAWPHLDVAALVHGHLELHLLRVAGLG